MKNLLTTAAVLIALTATASAQQTPLDRFMEAHYAISRLEARFTKSMAVCNQAKSEACKQAVTSTYPMLATIRQMARDSDQAQWDRVLKAVYEFEQQNEAALILPISQK